MTTYRILPVRFYIALHRLHSTPPATDAEVAAMIERAKRDDNRLRQVVRRGRVVVGPVAILACTIAFFAFGSLAGFDAFDAIVSGAAAGFAAVGAWLLLPVGSPNADRVRAAFSPLDAEGLARLDRYTAGTPQLAYLVDVWRCSADALRVDDLRRVAEVAAILAPLIERE